MPYFKIGKMAHDIVADHSESPRVAWMVIVCCISYFLCHPETLNLFCYIGRWFPRLTYDDNTDTVEDAACHRHTENICQYSYTRFPQNSTVVCCSVVFIRVQWTFHGICMKLLLQSLRLLVPLEGHLVS